MATNIIVADDHPLFRSAISHLLKRLIKGVEITEVEGFSELTEVLENAKPLPSLVLLDLKLADTQGIDGLLVLRKRYPSLPVVIVSAYDDTQVIHSAMRYGASGFIPKSLEMEAMADAISEVLDGDVWFPELSGSEQEEESESSSAFEELTSAQLKVLALLKQGKPSKEMANLMGVTEATIKAHLTVIFRKLNVRNRTQAVVAAKELDLPEDVMDIGK